MFNFLPTFFFIIFVSFVSLCPFLIFLCLNYKLDIYFKINIIMFLANGINLQNMDIKLHKYSMTFQSILSFMIMHTVDSFVFFLIENVLLISLKSRNSVNFSTKHKLKYFVFSQFCCLNQVFSISSVY